MVYRPRALFGGERRRSCPGQYILGTLDGRAMEQKEWEGVSSALNRANPGVLCGRCCFALYWYHLSMVDEGPPLCGVVRRREGTGDRPSSVVCFSEWFCFCRIFS